MKRVVPFAFLGMMLVGISPANAMVSSYSQIMQAVLTRNEVLLNYLVSAGVNINATDAHGYTPLCTTVENQDYQGYELLLSQGATTRTPCMKEMAPAVFDRFMTNQPPLGTYYKGAVLTAQRTGESIVQKEVASTISSLPFPHWGEFLIGGLVAGAAIAAGSGGGGGGGGGGGNTNVWSAPLTLQASYFSSPTRDTLSSTKKGGIPDVTDQLVSQYKNEYAGGVWTSGNENITNLNFLKVLNADAAYARGYSGTKVSRDEKGELTTTGWDAVTTTPVTVAVMDSGVLYHTDLPQNMYTRWLPDDPEDLYMQSKGLNYEYGVYSENNNKNYWEKTAIKSGVVLATLYKNGLKTDIITAFSVTNWDKYAGKFAPVCSSTITQNCLRASDTPESGYYKVEYVANSSATSALATYYVNHDLWIEYTRKYGETGYVYDATNATPDFFEEVPSSNLTHGTCTSGIIAAQRNGVGMQGVAYNAKILPVKLDFSASKTLLSEISEVANYSKIINLSIAPPEDATVKDNPASFISNKATENSEHWEHLLEYYDAMGTYSSVANQGAIQVFSAGNSGQYQSSIFAAAPLISEYNDAFKNLLINVVALGEADSTHTTGSITDYSNRCGATASYCLAAPGGTSTNPIISTGITTSSLTEGYQKFQGTSAAAPMVSGSLAVVMGAFPYLTSQEAVQILLKTATYIKPTEQEINDYNTLAVNSGYTDSKTAYDSNTKEGEYNAIYGRGLVNLEAATSPVGLPKITFDTTTNSSNTASVSTASITLSPTLASVATALPAQMIVLDDYNRAFNVSTSRFIKTTKNSDAFRRSFRSFMSQDEKEVAVSDKLAFAFSEAPKDKSGVYAGSMNMMMRPNKNVKVRFGYADDTSSFGGKYLDRAIQNPFMNMRQVFGIDTSFQISKNWALTGGWHTGKNGFIEEDIFDKMEHRPSMQLVESGVAYQGIKNTTVSVSAGLLNENASMLGMQGAGAFDLSGSQTRFVTAKVEILPYKNIRLSGSYTYGMTEAQKANSLLSFSKLVSDSFALAAEYQMDEKQKFGLTFTSPLRVRSGKAMFNLPVARDLYSNTIYRGNYASSLKPTAREYDLSFFYAQEMNDDFSWAGETGIRLHPDHREAATPDYRALLKMNWKW